MNSFFSTLQILLFVGAAQGLILSFVLFTLPRGNHRATRLLAAILVILSLNILLHTISHDSRLFGIPFHEEVIEFMLMLFGPLLYFYIKTLTSKSFVIGKKEFVHFLPFISLVIITLPFYFLSINSGYPHIVLKIVAGTAIVLVTIYLLFAIKVLVDHSRRIKESFSSLEKINLRWLKLIIIGFTSLLILGFLIESFTLIPEAWDIVWLMFSFFMYIIGYMGLRQPEVFSNIELNQVTEIGTSKKKYEKSTLTPEMADSCFNKLISYMGSEKPHLNSNINLPELANSLSIPVHHLSQIINERLNQNFFEFINSYRVEEAKRMLIDPEYQNINILSIGLDAGFNSVSAFNAAFKKHVKMTPSQYRNLNSKHTPIV